MAHYCLALSRGVGSHFDKFSSRSSFESDGGVNQASERCYTRGMTELEIFLEKATQANFESTSHYKRSLVLKQTIVPNQQHAKVRDTLRLFSCPSDYFSERASESQIQTVTVTSKVIQYW
jgi:hypothetical protein